MSMLVATVLLAPVAYRFEPNVRLDYRVDVMFDGFLPILGGNEGKAEVGMKVAVAGLAGDNGFQRATSEMTEFTIAFNGGKLPLTVDDARQYFPKTQISMTPQGKVVKSDAPNISLPVRLPGLDIKRFPDISYLPVELPEGDVSQGTKWEFKRQFGSTDIVYQCEATSLKDSMLDINVKIEQEYTQFENDALEIVAEEKDAVAQVTTKMTGSGLVKFDVNRGVAVSVNMSNKSSSKVVNIKSKKETTRVLNSGLKVQLLGPAGAAKPPVPTAPKSTGNSLLDLWNKGLKAGQDLWVRSTEYLNALKLLVQFTLSSAPGLGGLPIRFPF